MLNNVRLLTVLTTLFCGLCTFANAQENRTKSQSPFFEILTNQSLDRSSQFVTNNTMYILFHEVGHLLALRQNWPILGRWEDVADNFATYTLLNQHRRPFHEALKDAALRWKLDAEPTNDNLDNWQYWDEHSLDIQRAYQIICLSLGKDRDAFFAMAREWGIDGRRQIICGHDFTFLSRALLKHIKAPSENSSAPRVSINYQPASPNLLRARRFLIQSQLFEAMVQTLKTDYELDVSVILTAAECNGPGSFYDAPTNEITICYELIEEYFEQIDQYLATQNQASAQ